MSPRILILSSSTGGGHNMRAASFQAWAAQEQPAWAVNVHQTLEETHPFYAFGVELYNTIQRRAPYLHHLYFNQLEIMGLFRNERCILGKKRFAAVLEAFKPNVVLSVHASTNHGFFDLSRRVLGRDNVRCVTYCGELYGGYGLSRHWINPNADLFIGAVAETCSAAIQAGMPKERCWAGGFLLRPEFYEACDRIAVRHALAQECGFDPEQFILVLSTGANSAHNHDLLLRCLETARVQLQVVALCGEDTTAKERIEATYRGHARLRVRALGRRKDMVRWMLGADAIVARPGTGTTSEAIQLGCPLLLNGLGGIMPQEWITVKYCRKHRLGDPFLDARQFLRTIRHWLQEPDLLVEQRARMQRVRPQRHPLEILARVVGEETA